MIIIVFNQSWSIYSLKSHLVKLLNADTNVDMRENVKQTAWGEQTQGGNVTGLILW